MADHHRGPARLLGTVLGLLTGACVFRRPNHHARTPCSYLDLRLSFTDQQKSRANGEAAKERCLRSLQGFEESVLRLVAETDPSAIVEHAIYVR